MNVDRTISAVLAVVDFLVPYKKNWITDWQKEQARLLAADPSSSDTPSRLALIRKSAFGMSGLQDIQLYGPDGQYNSMANKRLQELTGEMIAAIDEDLRDT